MWSQHRKVTSNKNTTSDPSISIFFVTSCTGDITIDDFDTFQSNEV